MNFSKSLLDTIFNTSTDALLVFDKNYEILVWNKTLEALTEITANEVVGKKIIDKNILLEGLIEKQYLENTLKGNSWISLDRRIKLSQMSSPEIYEMHYIPWKNDSSEEVLGGLIRIRRQLNTESNVPISSNGKKDDRFKIMADCAPVMLWMSGLDARCTFFNQSWLTFSGKTLEEELGYGWAEGIHHEDFQHSIDTYMEAFNARREFAMEYRLKRDDGHYRWIYDRGRPFWNSEGLFSGFIGSCTDITALKEAEELAIEKKILKTQLEEREKSSQALRVANEELEAFAYSVSHDLRAPLRAINGFSCALIEDCLNELAPEAQRYLEHIKKGTEEMNFLINEILNLSRVSRHQLRKQSLAPKIIVGRVLNEMKSLYPGQQVELEIGSLPKCFADPTLIKQVYINLIDNAFKYSRKTKKPKIEIGWKEVDGEGIYYVRDNGAGFDMGQVDKLFGVFQRLHSSEMFEGTGLGLSIVQRIIKRHGGRIWAEAKVDQGATFYFTLPGSNQEEQKEQLGHEEQEGGLHARP